MNRLYSLFFAGLIFLTAGVHFCSYATEFKNTAEKAAASNSYASQSILSDGNWVKLASANAGIQKISYSKLTELGISNPSNVAVYSNGGYMLPKLNADYYPDDLTLLPVIHSKDKNGNNCIFFYSPGTVKWNYDSANKRYSHSINLYSDSTYFYLSSDVTPSPLPSANEVVTETPDTTISTYIALDFFEEENINLLSSGREWYSNQLTDGLKKSYNFTFPNALSGPNAIITAYTAARCSTNSDMSVKINNAYSYNISYAATNTATEHISYWARENSSTWEAPASNNKITVDFTYNANGNNGGLAWLDKIGINIPCNLTFTGSQLDFQTYESLPYNCVEYKVKDANSNCLIWNVSTPLAPKQMTASFNSASNEITFNHWGGLNYKYIIFDPVNGSFTEPKTSAKVHNQNIHGQTGFDMIIVTHPDFSKQSEELAEFHRQYDNLSVLVVTTPEVYNEFSSGLPDPASIRNMFRLFYQKSPKLKYALLMGDGSFNNRGTNKEKIFNFIPTYESANSISDAGDSFVSDDFFGLLDDNEGETDGKLDIGIGRIPCKSAAEADVVLNKIKDYSCSKTLGDWRNIVCFIADDEDANTYMSDAEELNTIINSNYPGFFTKKIYIDAYEQQSGSGGFEYPEASAEISQTVNNGALIVNYIGHGNPHAMALENIVTMEDISSWKNSNALSLFITATCEFGPFDSDDLTAAENILLNPSGGGIAVFTTCRVVSGSANQTLSRKFYDNIFKVDATGEKLRLGDVMKNAKNESGSGSNHQFNLLADPALRLAFPQYKVVTQSINGKDINSEEITIGALDKVTINGYIADHNDNLISDYNGTVITRVYDKKQTIETLANDGGKPFSYQVQDNVIYKGEASVVNGKFEVTFIVPKDISYNKNSGRIIYYTSDGTSDGNGAITNFNIGGSGSTTIVENDPPEMEVYMNNENFKSNDKVSPSALLWVNVSDESGINAAGAGIGHDLIAVLDGDYTNPIILNNYYSSIADNYQKGRIIYPFTNLEAGKHTLWVKVWDVQNNSAEQEISFIVDNGFKVTAVQNFPNPVVSYTDFSITHNLPGDVFDVYIDVYSLSGRKIGSLAESTVNSNRTTTISVRWNVYQSDVPVYPNQILIYKVTLKNQDGLSAYGAGKMMIKANN